MKKMMSILTVTFLGTAVLFNGYVNTQASDNTSAIEIQKKWEDYVQTEIKNKLSETYEDAITVFQFDKSDYTYHSLHEQEFQGLGKEISNRLFITVFKTVLTKQKQGDFEPGLFLNKDLSEAVILYKSIDSGDNHMFVFKRNGDDWTLTKQDSQKGKKVEKVKYKKLKEFKAENNE